MWTSALKRLVPPAAGVSALCLSVKQQLFADDCPRTNIRVLSFNIQWALRAQGRQEPLKPVARLAAACGADIICLQEVLKATTACKPSSGVSKFGCDQPNAVARLLEEVDGKGWSHAFGSNHEFGPFHERGPAHFGNAILWSIPASHPQPGGVIQLQGDPSSHIGACREGRCAIGVLVKHPDVAVVTVHLGFKSSGTQMLRDLLQSLGDGCYVDKTIVLCGDFNSYAEEGLNPANDIEDAGRFKELMDILASHGFKRVANVGPLVHPTDSGAAPFVGVGPTSSQEPCFVTFPYWSDTSTRWDSVDHQLDYFFVRPRAGYPAPLVRQFIPVAAQGISDHNGILIDIEL